MIGFSSERNWILSEIPELNKIRSLNFLREMYEHLRRNHPTHNQKLNFVGFMQFAGYDDEEIFQIIDKRCTWIDYTDEEETRAQIAAVRQREQHQPIYSRAAKQHNQQQPEYTFEELIDVFLRDTIPLSPMQVPENIHDAIEYYHSRGFHIIPKGEANPKDLKPKKKPAVRWKKYQDEQPSKEDISNPYWQKNFEENGLIIVATDKLSFFDVDPDGLIKVDVSRFRDRHIEQTPRGGYHVYGIGRTISKDIPKLGEIKGKGRYVVAYPSPGYMLVRS